MANIVGLSDRRERLATPLDEGQRLVSALFRNSIVGVAVFDSQLRYRKVNAALASINGLPVEAHIGKRIQEVLGKEAAKADPVIERVLSQSAPFSNFQLHAKLSTRADVGSWVDNFYPLQGSGGKTLHVGVIIWEITKTNRLEDNLSHLASRLRNASETLGTVRGATGGSLPKRSLSETGKILDDCIAETRAVEYLLRSGLLRTAKRHDETVFPPLTSSPAPDHNLSYGPGKFESHRLTRREIEVLTFLAAGKSNKEVAAILEISVRTVETHRANLMIKLGIHSVAELARFAIRNKLLEA